MKPSNNRMAAAKGNRLNFMGKVGAEGNEQAGFALDRQGAFLPLGALEQAVESQLTPTVAVLGGLAGIRCSRRDTREIRRDFI